jgi:cation-transporting ATPase V
VEKLLSEQPDVASASVNFAAGEAYVSGTATLPDLQGVITDAGYALLDVEPATVHDEPDEAPGLRRLQLAAALTLPVFVLAMFGFDGSASRGLQALLTAIVTFGCGIEFHRGAWLRARHGSANMDTLIALGTLSAFVASSVALVRGGPLFFETAAVITTLVLFGRHLEARARGRAASAISGLAALAATDACIVRDDVEQRVPAETLAVGDVVRIRPGEKIPTDVVVLEGESEVDESAFTGEPLHRPCGPGDELRGASINGTGVLLARATAVGSDTVLAGILRLVEETQASKAPVERLADRVAGRFVPAVLGIALVTGLGWLAAGAAPAAALSNAIAVLVIACPCALGLATPTAISVGTGRGAELGVLFRGADVFERSRRIDTVLFDKTGTLTRGEMTLDTVVADDEQALLHAAASVEAASEHSIAQAIVAGAIERGVEPGKASQFGSQPGRGAWAEVDGEAVRIGSPAWLRESGLTIAPPLASAIETLESQGRTVVVCAFGGSAGALALRDAPREGAAQVIGALTAMGIEVGLVTGDNARAASAVGRELGIETIHAEVLPEDKAKVVADLQERGRHVAFVGDGVNDAPALQRADLGLAVGTGTDVAIESGSAVLATGEPRLALVALALSRRTYRAIGQNLFWAFAYNAAAIPLAALGGLDPMLAAGAMALSSVSVVANSLRVRRFAPPALA